MRYLLNKFSDRTMKVKLPALIGNYDRPTDEQTGKLNFKQVYMWPFNFLFLPALLSTTKAVKWMELNGPLSHLFPLVGLICGTCKEKFCLVQEDARRVPKRYLSLQTFQDQSMHFLN